MNQSVEKTKKAPASAKNEDTVEPADTVDTSGLKAEAQAVIDRFSKYSFISGFIPFVVLDLAAVITSQVKMIEKIAEVYDQKYSDVGVRASISSFLGAVVPQTLSTGGSSAIKSIPVIGTIAGIVVSPALYALSTQAVGSAFVKHFESGGTFIDLDFSKVSEHTSSFIKSKKAEKEEAA